MKTINEYDQQAEKFLADNGIKFRATLADAKLPPWKSDNEASGHHYRVTLSKAEGKEVWPHRAMVIHGNKRLTFDFWGSIADAKNGDKTVTPYDVLACISGDVNCPETFEDFCAEYDYETDSIKALQMFRRCDRFGKRLRAFFTADEIEQLTQIQ